MQHHYETLLRVKEEQLESSLRINEKLEREERERWNSALNELKERQQNILSSLEDRIKVKYENLLEVLQPFDVCVIIIKCGSGI